MISLTPSAKTNPSWTSNEPSAAEISGINKGDPPQKHHKEAKTDTISSKEQALANLQVELHAPNGATRTGTLTPNGVKAILEALKKH